MTDGIMLQISDDGKATLYESTYDITIHCESEKEQREVMERLNSMSWIPVSERLPEEGQDVLITKESFKIKGYEQKIIKAKRSVDPRSGKIEWWSPEFGTLTNKAVLAWMPLPEPYKGENE